MSTPTRRRSSRLAPSSSPSAPLESLPDTKKRKAKEGASPAGKKSKQEPKQQSLEESVKPGNNAHAAENEKKEEVGDEDLKDKDVEQAGDVTMGNAKQEDDADEKADGKAQSKPESDSKAKESKTEVAETNNDDTTESKAEEVSNGTAKAQDEPPTDASAPATANGDGAVEESSQREEQVASNVLEKGIFYFFARGRVGLESAQPSKVNEIARSYIVLRPLPTGASLSADVLPESNSLRVLALPKKVLPSSGKDRFMCFVDAAGATPQQVKDGVLAGSTYETQTAGVRSSPAATPLAEGVYAITTTGRESHLAYILAIPHEPGEVQRGVGLADRGSFILSTRNPETSGPAYAQLDEPASFPQHIMDAFAGRRWMPTEPAHLDHKNCQVLLIGEAQDALGKAAQASDDAAADAAAPEEEMELLEDEELKRVQALKGDDTIFADLGISKKEFPQVQTTW